MLRLKLKREYNALYKSVAIMSSHHPTLSSEKIVEGLESVVMSLWDEYTTKLATLRLLWPASISDEMWQRYAFGGFCRSEKQEQLDMYRECLYLQETVVSMIENGATFQIPKDPNAYQVPDTRVWKLQHTAHMIIQSIMDVDESIEFFSQTENEKNSANCQGPCFK